MFLVVLSESKYSNAVFILQHKRRIARLYHFVICLPIIRDLAYFLKHIQNNLNPEYYEDMTDHIVSDSIYIDDPIF